MGKLLEELKRRKVFRVAAVYAVVAWVLIQVADVVSPALGAPEWLNQAIIFLFILGFFPTLVAAWAYEIGSDGVRPDGHSLPSQISTPSLDRKLIFATFVLVLLASGSQITDRFIIDGQTNVADSRAGLTFQSVNELSTMPMGRFSVPIREDGDFYISRVADSSFGRSLNASLSTSPAGLVELWEAGQTAFGQYVTGVPFTVETGRELAANPLLDYAFLNLEQDYNINSALDLAQGLESGTEGTPMELLVRIPPMSEAGVETSKARVKELLAMGADGVVFPHVRSAEEARTAVSFFEGVNVWSPANPDGDIVVMLMLETPDVFAELEEIANIPNYSSLACGIGSLTNALGGDREAAEKMNLEVLIHSQRVGMADMITANTESVARRVDQGFLGLLVYGPTANEVIRLGRAAAGR
jgi:2-keto-3-deoxy-L-rhamnonate aldolase RhmA